MGGYAALYLATKQPQARLIHYHTQTKFAWNLKQQPKRASMLKDGTAMKEKDSESFPRHGNSSIQMGKPGRKTKEMC